jgi:membrane protease YdiL (CAAX protease family)
MPSILTSVYLNIAELSLWFFLSTILNSYVPSRLLALAILGLVIYRRYGMSALRRVLNLRLTLPIIILGFSAVSKYTSALEALTSNPTSILITPISEELLYRFVIPKIVNKIPLRVKPKQIVTVLVPALLFCFAHRNNPSQNFLADMLVCFLSGSALNLRAQKTNSIIETFLIHALHNLHVVANKVKTEMNLDVFPGVQIITPCMFYGTMIVHDSLVIQ